MNALWMVVAAVLFSLMGACVKLAARHYGVFEIVFYRSLFGVVSLYAFVGWRRMSLSTPHVGAHLRRSVVGTLALSLWFYATTLLPLGTAMTLNYTSPLFLAAFVVGLSLRGGVPADWRLVSAVVVGFVGVLLVLQPSFAPGQTLAALAGLTSGVLSAAAYWYVRELGALGEPEWRTVFYFSATGAVLGGAGALAVGFSPHTVASLWLLAAVGVTATLAQLAMTRAFGLGGTLVVANLQFSAVVFASLLGIVLFGDHIPAMGWIGIAVIIASGAISTVFIARRPVARTTGPSTERG
jgi:S-adenosylmethionine uptake transporter